MNYLTIYLPTYLPPTYLSTYQPREHGRAESWVERENFLFQRNWFVSSKFMSSERQFETSRGGARST